jgi:hypothetical protein
MGEFSYLCKSCGSPINAGEQCIMFLLHKGKIVEHQRGINSNYGYCEQEEYEDGPDDTWKYKNWNDLCELQFGVDKRSGFAVYHDACWKGEKPMTRSENDPNQGWGKHRQKFNRKSKYGICKVCFSACPNGITLCNKDKCVAEAL